MIKLGWVICKNNKIKYIKYDFKKAISGKLILVLKDQVNQWKQKFMKLILTFDSFIFVIYSYVLFYLERSIIFFQNPHLERSGTGSKVTSHSLRRFQTWKLFYFVLNLFFMFQSWPTVFSFKECVLKSWGRLRNLLRCNTQWCKVWEMGQVQSQISIKFLSLVFGTAMSTVHSWVDESEGGIFQSYINLGVA